MEPSFVGWAGVSLLFCDCGPEAAAVSAGPWSRTTIFQGMGLDGFRNFPTDAARGVSDFTSLTAPLAAYRNCGESRQRFATMRELAYAAPICTDLTKHRTLGIGRFYALRASHRNQRFAAVADDFWRLAPARVVVSGAFTAARYADHPDPPISAAPDIVPIRCNATLRDTGPR